MHRKICVWNPRAVIKENRLAHKPMLLAAQRRVVCWRPEEARRKSSIATGYTAANVMMRRSLKVRATFFLLPSRLESKRRSNQATATSIWVDPPRMMKVPRAIRKGKLNTAASASEQWRYMLRSTNFAARKS